MSRTVSLIVGLSTFVLPATASADVPPQPLPFMSVNEAILVGCILLGLALSVFAFRMFRPDEDPDSDSSSG